MAFQHVAQVACRVHLVGLRLGVKLFLTRCKQHIATCFVQALGIGIQRAGVAVKVFMRRKLQAVHKDTGNRDVAQGLGLTHQCYVAIVQVAHGGHKCRALEAAEFFA